MKTCTKCKQDLPLEAFNKNKRGKDGLDPRCRECRKYESGYGFFDINDYQTSGVKSSNADISGIGNYHGDTVF